jgi:alcohol dehydrogenase
VFRVGDRGSRRHAGRLDTGQFITHRFAMNEMTKAYEVFAHPQDTGALKVVLTRD